MEDRIIELFKLSDNSTILSELIREKDNYDANKLLEDGYSALHHASKCGNLSAFAYLVLEGGGDPLVECKDKSANSLHIACLYGHIEIVKIILEKWAGCGPNIESHEKHLSPLHFAILGNHLSVVKYLIMEMDANIFTVDHKGMTVLMLAAQEGHLEIVKYLVEEAVTTLLEKQDTGGYHKGDLLLFIDFKDANDWAALHYAILNDHTEVVAYLLGKSAKQKDSISKFKNELTAKYELGMDKILPKTTEDIDNRMPFSVATASNSNDSASVQAPPVPIKPTPADGLAPEYFEAPHPSIQINRRVVFRAGVSLHYNASSTESMKAEVPITACFLGTVRYIGFTLFAPGYWIGIELDGANGKNNGSVLGVQYFECREKHGIFARSNLVSVVDKTVQGQGMLHFTTSELDNMLPKEPDHSIELVEEEEFLDDKTLSLEPDVPILYLDERTIRTAWDIAKQANPPKELFPQLLSQYPELRKHLFLLRNESGYSLLMRAAAVGNLGTVKYLLEEVYHPKTVNLKSFQHSYINHSVAVSGSTNNKSGDSINGIKLRGSAFFYACLFNQINVVQYLWEFCNSRGIELDISVSTPSGPGIETTILHIIASRGARSHELTQFLLEKFPFLYNQIESQDHSLGYTILHYAAKRDNLELVKYILNPERASLGAHWNLMKESFKGESAYHLAKSKDVRAKFVQFYRHLKKLRSGKSESESEGYSSGGRRIRKRRNGDNDSVNMSILTDSDGSVSRGNFTRSLSRDRSGYNSESRDRSGYNSESEISFSSADPFRRKPGKAMHLLNTYASSCKVRHPRVHPRDSSGRNTPTHLTPRVLLRGIGMQPDDADLSYEYDYDSTSSAGYSSGYESSSTRRSAVSSSNRRRLVVSEEEEQSIIARMSYPTKSSKVRVEEERRDREARQQKALSNLNVPIESRHIRRYSEVRDSYDSNYSGRDSYSEEIQIPPKLNRFHSLLTDTISSNVRKKELYVRRERTLDTERPRSSRGSSANRTLGLNTSTKAVSYYNYDELRKGSPEKRNFDENKGNSGIYCKKRVQADKNDVGELYRDRKRSDTGVFVPTRFGTNDSERARSRSTSASAVSHTPIRRKSALEIEQQVERIQMVSSYDKLLQMSSAALHHEEAPVQLAHAVSPALVAHPSAEQVNPVITIIPQSSEFSPLHKSPSKPSISGEQAVSSLTESLKSYMETGSVVTTPVTSSKPDTVSRYSSPVKITSSSPVKTVSKPITRESHNAEDIEQMFRGFDHDRQIYVDIRYLGMSPGTPLDTHAASNSDEVVDTVLVKRRDALLSIMYCYGLQSLVAKAFYRLKHHKRYGPKAAPKSKLLPISPSVSKGKKMSPAKKHSNSPFAVK